MSAAESVAVYCDSILSLCDPNDPKGIAAAAADSDEHLAAVDAIVDSVRSGLLGAPHDDARLALWLFLDKLCKRNPVFVEALRPHVVELAAKVSPLPGTRQHPLFTEVVGSLRHLFGAATATLMSLRLADRAATAAAAAGSDGLGGASAAAGAGGAAAAASQSSALVEQHNRQIRTIGAGFTVSRANGARPEGRENRLAVKTRDSLIALRVGGAYVPAMPAEMVLPVPQRAANAPAGHMTALPEGHVASYIEQRRKRMREAKDRFEERAEATRAAVAAGNLRANGGDGNGGDVSGAQRQTDKALERIRGIVMPLELPRDEFGVKIGNFPEGVRFLRDAVRQCGGAVELDVLASRVATMADREAQREFGTLRAFLEIHTPTFRLTIERDRPIVRLTEDFPAAQPNSAVDLPGFGSEAAVPSVPQRNGLFSWEEAECGGCSRLLRGRNMPRHRDSRDCCRRQAANGLTGHRLTTPIAELSFAAKTLGDRLRAVLSAPNADAHDLDDACDDDDIVWFANALAAAGAVPRFRLSSPKYFIPVLRTVFLVRDLWLRRKGVAANGGSVGDIPVSYEDRAFVLLFEALGANYRRLPIPWIETGDVIELCRRFSRGVLPPFPPPPKAGDPRIRTTNTFPGFLFCESDSDHDDDPSEDEQAFSDDEAAAFEFAPPVTTLETVMIAGRERDTRRLNHRLRTAPPMQLTRVLKGERMQTLQTAYETASAADEARRAALAGMLEQSARQANEDPNFGGAAGTVRF